MVNRNEKDQYGATGLFSLADFKGIRENTPFGKWYDSGRFAATPVIDKLAFELAYKETTEEAQKTLNTPKRIPR